MTTLKINVRKEYTRYMEEYFWAQGWDILRVDRLSYRKTGTTIITLRGSFDEINERFILPLKCSYSEVV